MRSRLRAIKEEMRRQMHEPIPVQARRLNQVALGDFGYHAVPTNSRRLDAFRYHVLRHWHRTLRRRGQMDFTSWDRISRLAPRLPAYSAHSPSLAIYSIIRRQPPRVEAEYLN
jgi:hypothetical protein